MWARIHLIPVMQAEEDRDQVRRQLADKAREKELLGTDTRVYHSDRFVSFLQFLYKFNCPCLVELIRYFIVDLCAQHMQLHQSRLRNDFPRRCRGNQHFTFII